MNREAIQDFIDEDINPALSMHGGHLTIVSVDDGIVKIELSGGCQGCSSASETVKSAASELMKNKFPQITDIKDITDHTAGEDPYHK
jgi:Fe/S biogenesis protein NfuA|tara:strand:- start:7504 stop:7764 length:261 start_codon:yes stop_codon:yes gene_type:complete